MAVQMSLLTEVKDSSRHITAAARGHAIAKALCPGVPIHIEAVTVFTGRAHVRLSYSHDTKQALLLQM